MHQKFIYAVFSSTPYRIGRFIRRLTGEPYNHISISLDSKLQTMYSFARRYYRTPFYGGFVKETPARYSINGMNTTIEVFRIPVSDQLYASIQSRLDAMYQNKERYLYNHFSAWLYPLHCKIPVKDAYSCVEFSIDILKAVGIPLDEHKHYSIGELRTILKPHQHYQGELQSCNCIDQSFFTKKPLPYPLLSSLRSIAALIPRIAQK